MTSKSFRRLASDHASLHAQGLPPNYLFVPGKEDDFSDLSSLSVLLAGPEGTAFSNGVYTLELNIPSTYPQAAPTAHFRTRIFHPNVDPTTGAVCVETLKRDWKPELTLRDILITINCLLVYPNPASALNAEAGRLVDEDFKEYERKAGLWARMHAAIPPALKAAVDEARSRGDKGDAEEHQLPTTGLAADKQRRRRERERKGDGEDVFVREDSIHTTPPSKNHESSSSTVPAPAAPPKGLGIDFMPDSTLNASFPETPTQPAAPARRRKKLFQDESASGTTSAAAFLGSSDTVPIQTPTAKPFIHSNPSTPRLGQPEPKRRRLTPESEAQGEKQELHDASATQRSDTVSAPLQTSSEACSWLAWQTRSPQSSPDEDEAKRKRRKTAEKARLDAVGGCLALYNIGRIGPRTGVERL